MLFKSTSLTLLFVLTCQVLFAQFNETGAVGPTVPRESQLDDPFSDDEVIEQLSGVQDEIGATEQPHPLGLLPNPVIRTDTRYTYEDLIWRKIDTTLLRFHEYNPVWKKRYPHMHLGNLAQNYRSLVFDPKRKTGLQAGINAYEDYWATPEKVRYFNTKIPFTNIYYNLGTGAENYAKATHAQNVGPFYNASFDYSMMNSKGDYSRQKTLIHAFSVNNWFNTKSHRYTMMFAFLFNKMANYENGGVDMDNLFNKENSGVSRTDVPIHLEMAENKASNKSLHLKQIFFLGEKQTVMTGDTTDMEIVKRRSALSYTFNYNNWKYKYTDSDPDTSFYTNFFNDSTLTGDSTWFWTASHSIRWENTPETWGDSGSTISPNRYFLSLDYDYTNYTNLNIQKKWNDLAFSGGINSNLLLDKKWHYGVAAKVNAAPKTLGDFSMEVFFLWEINGKMHTTFSAQTKRSSPNQREQKYNSNHHKWSNDFDPVYNNKLSLLFKWDRQLIDAELTWHNIQNFIYMDGEKTYRQSMTNQNVLVFRASKAFDWKHFYFYSGLTAQFISDRHQLALPKFIFKQSFHYQGGFAKGLLTANLGFDINYHTNYFADGYDPALMEFYRQDVENLKFYPELDLFFEIFIKRARIFFLLKHVNQGMFAQKGYFVAPDYAAQDRAFKVGVSWQFYD